MSRQNKTRMIATYPDGSRIIIRKGYDYLGYEWQYGCSSQYIADAIRNAKESGATVTTEPNPCYQTELSALRDSFGRIIS